MHRKQLAYIALAAGTALGLASVQLTAHPSAREQRGWASWYGPGFAGRPTASGERFSPQALTAAHRSWPLGTRARVTNLETGQQVEVTINDRGPFADPERRVIDLSRAAATQIGMVQQGVGPVRVTVIDTPRPRPRRASQVARASRRPVGAERRPEPPQQLPPPAPGPWLVASRLAAPGARAHTPTADPNLLNCRVTPAICLAGD
jgi:rare lipoprotein A (peptidoglycan hydrolase)